MVDINKIKNNDVLYTLHECFDDESGVSYGRISICVKEVLFDTNAILAHGQIVYDIEDLTDVKPNDDEYSHFGEGFRDYLIENNL